MSRTHDALRVALAPDATYGELLASAHTGSWPRAFSGPAFAGFLFATCLSVVATTAASLPTIVSVGLCWIFVPAVQLLMAWWMCRPAVGRMSVARAIELQFLSHAPWSMWLVGVAFSSLWIPTDSLLHFILVTIALPAVWTPILLASFCRNVLRLGQREARRRAAAHQLATWTLITLYALLSIQPWARVGAA